MKIQRNAQNRAGKKTTDQLTTELIEWYLSDHDVEVVFIPNEKRRGRIIPEFDIHFKMAGRAITERGLAMCINCELTRRNYSFQLSRIISGITEQVWRYYVATQPYPEWMQEPAPVVRRPRGRPRKHPPKIDLPPLDDAEPTA